jgi:hypothetical protein
MKVPAKAAPWSPGLSMSPVMLCAISCSKTVVLMRCRGILMRSRFAVATLLVAAFDISGATQAGHILCQGSDGLDRGEPPTER